MFDSSRLARLLQRFTGGSDAPAESAAPVSASAAAQPAGSTAPAAPGSGVEQGSGAGSSNNRGGGRGGRGRGGRGGQQQQQRPQSARSPQPSDSPMSDEAEAGNSTERTRGGRSGRGGGSGGRGRGGRGGRGGNQAQTAIEQGAAESADAASDAAAGGRGRGRGRGRGGRGGARGGAAAPTGALDASAAEFVPGAAAASLAAPAASPSPSPQPSTQQLPRGPSKKQLAAARAAEAAARAAEEQAKLDDPNDPRNIPSPALATELRLLGQRWNKSFRSSQHRSSVLFSLSFAPSDPDFPFALPPEHLVLQFVLHDISLYPYAPLSGNEAQQARSAARVEIKCLNAERDVPAHIREVVEGSLHYFITRTQLGQNAMLRNTLKMLDREITDWMQLAQKKHNEKVAATLARLQGPAAAAAAAAAAATPAGGASTPAAAAPSGATTPSVPPVGGASSVSPSTTASLSSVPSTSPSASPAAPAPSSSPPADATTADADAADEWTPAQQSALEAALKSVSKTLPATERWEAIAALVPDKNKKQCLARYKFIRDSVKSGAPLTVSSTPAAASAAAAAAASSAAAAAAAPTVPRGLSFAQEVDADESAALHARRVREQQLEREAEEAATREAEEERRQAKGTKSHRAQPKKAQRQDGSKESGSDDGSSGASDSDADSDDSGADDDFVATTERLSLNPAHRGTQLLIGELRMEGVGILKSQLLRAQLLCCRCDSRVDIEFGPSNGTTNPVVQRCGRCGVHHSVRYRPEMLHEHSDSLGYVDLENAELFDLRPSDLYATCLECFTEAPVKNFSRGSTFDSNCRQCHQRLFARFESIEFNRVTPAANVLEAPKQDSRGRKAAEALDPLEVAAAKNRRKEQSLLKVGTPLPNKGTCKHYARSYRWMRFPCCGKAYPCDVCHATEEGHSGVWATRMICGGCSKEQPFSAKPCVNCGLAFTAQAKKHWEGGQGMRDRARLSKNDSKKHSGLNKTVSAKSQRVGPKAGAEAKHKKKDTGNTA